MAAEKKIVLLIAGDTMGTEKRNGDNGAQGARAGAGVDVDTTQPPSSVPQSGARVHNWYMDGKKRAMLAMVRELHENKVGEDKCVAHSLARTCFLFPNPYSR